MLMVGLFLAGGLLCIACAAGTPTPDATLERPQTEATRQAVEAPAPANVDATYSVGTRPRSITLADFNQDRLPDVAVANAGDGTVTVLYGIGGGRLGGSEAFEAGHEPADVDAVDVDRDGDADIVVANHDTPGFSVLLNDGRGHFAMAAGMPIDTGARPHVHGLATGDFDGDGWVDVAVDSADTNEIRVVRGGPRGFSLFVGVPVGTMPYYRIGVGDVTGDGRPDVVVPGQRDNTVRAVGSVDGRLASVDWMIRLQNKPWMVVTGDVNGDARADVIVAETDAVSIWQGSETGYLPVRGSPFLVKTATEVAVGDLGGDGLSDVAAGPWEGSSVALIFGGGSAVREIEMCERPIGLAIGDLDLDGADDLLAACATSDRLVVKTVHERPAGTP